MLSDLDLHYETNAAQPFIRAGEGLDALLCVY